MHPFLRLTFAASVVGSVLSLPSICRGGGTTKGRQTRENQRRGARQRRGNRNQKEGGHDGRGGRGGKKRKIEVRGKNYIRKLDGVE